MLVIIAKATKLCMLSMCLDLPLSPVPHLKMPKVGGTEWCHLTGQGNQAQADLVDPTLVI